MQKRSFATMSWSQEDVREVAPQLSQEEAQAWLEANEKHLRERLTEAGYRIIEALMDDGFDSGDLGRGKKQAD